ncbi:unnamed protein product [Symbiodinium sp. CCMP2592]|nr:unnamed protein product [Symbiodinium sp. CCMP2592]
MEAGELEEEQADEAMGMPDAPFFADDPEEKAKAEAEDKRSFHYPSPEGRAESPTEVIPPPDPLPPPEWLYRLDVECRAGSQLQVIRLPVPGHSTSRELLERLHMRTGLNLGALRLVPDETTAPLPFGDPLCMSEGADGNGQAVCHHSGGSRAASGQHLPVVSMDMLWCIACRVRAPSPEHMQAHLMTASHVLAVAEYLASFREPASG